MKNCFFPEGKRLFDNKPFSKEFIELTLEEIFKAHERFTGFIKVCKGEEMQFFLFFLKGDPYAAGEVLHCRPSSITIKDFFERLLPDAGKRLTVSLHETDPVALKDMIVFMQKEPTIKALTSLIDLEDISGQIDNETADALIALNKNGKFNFFFFKDGAAVMSHFADTDFEVAEDTPVSDRMLLYAYPPDLAPVEALIYKDISTEQALDAEAVSQVDMIKMLYNVADAEHEDVSPLVGTDEKGACVNLVIVDGPRKGDTLRGSVPCIIGRKGVDIIIEDLQVSRRHAGLRELNGKLVIEDLGSTNGTYVNKEEIKVKELSEGDIITVGETSIKVESCGRS